MDPRSNGRISAVCLGYIMILNTIPAVLGTVLCIVIKPGVFPVWMLCVAYFNERKISWLPSGSICWWNNQA